MSSLIAGDHLRAKRPSGYWHHGIYVGDERVIEFGGDKRAKAEAQVQEVSLHEFQDRSPTETVSHELPSILAMWAPIAVPREGG